MNRADARDAALDQREGELNAIRSGAMEWPPEPRHTLLRGEDGVTRAALARALGCTPQALAKVLPDPIGLGYGSKRSFDLYDSDLAYMLVDADPVRASRLRKSVRVTDTERRARIFDHLSELTGVEILRVEVGSFRSVNWLSFETSALTVLFGKNGAGKSTIIEALRRGAGRVSSLRGLQGAGEPQVGLGLRVHVSRTAEECAVAASYLALGLREPERSLVEDLWTALLQRPHAYGTPGNWMLACDPSARSSLLPTLKKLSNRERRIPSKVTEEMLEALSSATDEPFPIKRVEVQLPGIRVLSLSDDTSAIARDLYERIGEHLRPSNRRLGVTQVGSHVELEDHELDEEPASHNLRLTWFDDHQMECAPADAEHIEVTLGPNVHRARLGNVDELRDVIDRVSEDWAGGDEQARTDLRLLYTVARYGGPGEATSAWLDPTTQDQAVQLAAAIDTRANELAPSFVRVEGRIVLLPPRYESAGHVGIVLLSADGRMRSLDQLPSGIARWVGLVIDLATHEVLTGLSSRSGEGEATSGRASLEPVLFLADEPELHLHPSAQEEVVRWMIDWSATRTSIVATHAAPFLRLAPSEGQVVRVLEHPTEGVKALPLRGALLGELDEMSAELGLGRDWVLQLVRGVLFVEGLVDQAVLSLLAQDLLTRSRLLVVPLHGHSQTKALAQAELMLALGLPVAVLFDCITADDLDKLSNNPESKVSHEAQSAQRLLALRDRGLDCTVIPYDDGDICGAIPEETVKARYPKFPGWETIRRRVAKADEELSFKHAFLDSIGVSRKKDGETIVGLAESWDGHAPLPAPISRALAALEAWSDTLGTRSSLDIGVESPEDRLEGD